MIKCPNCQATLPDEAVSCQFCGKAWGAPPRPTRGPRMQPDTTSGSPRWVLPVYYLIAVWWIVDGVRSVVGLLALKHNLWGLWGLIDVAMGVGLLMRVEVVRGLVNLFSFVQILLGVLGIVTGFLMSAVMGFYGALLMLINTLEIAAAVFMIFLIGETETRGPNF
jgi:hypothetical protein